ncbi:restriction endonuclease subunit S [Prevotella merdae]|uniref:restriction endonuclease subunit S n=1 Tax=Prevotella merdae TaxID=2079531 RepID=UPI003F81F02F
MKDLGIFMSGLTYSPTDLSNKDEGILVLRSSNIQNGKLVYADNVYVNCHLDTNQMVKENDVLICSRNGSARLVGKTAIIPYGLKATWGAFMMLFRPYKKNSNYLNYVFSSQIEKYKGMFSTSTINQLTNSMLGNMFIDYEEDGNVQQRIVTYLDTKLSEIDTQMSILTSKRDAYLRLKKSIINHAVTRGLNPNVKMKDSGIEWIGEVPEHWEVKRLKNVVECNAKSLGENTPKDSIIKYVEISDVDHVHGINNIQSLMFGEAPSRARRITQKGDIIISTVRTYLKAIAKIEDDDIIVSTGFAVLHPTKCNGEYLAYYILSESFINRVEMLSKGTSYPAINASDLVSINVLIPPLPEQHAIATYLGDKCAKIDTIVSNLDKQISRYADLKCSLIDEVITGKRAV